MAEQTSTSSGYVAYRILQIAFIVVPIIAGLDKFFHYFTKWTVYLSPQAVEVLRSYSHPFMIAVGVVEILVGIGVIFAPRVFGYIVGFWLLLVIINLILSGTYYDIALRDLGLMLAAFALGLLGQEYKKKQ